MKTSEEIRAARLGQLIRTTGIVINRQRPDTESGVIFATLEDEMGLINVTVWRTVAGHLVDHSDMLGKLATTSRDFH